jgi:hypothetical protein
VSALGNRQLFKALLALKKQTKLNITSLVAVVLVL